MKAGATGVVSVASNLIPEAMVELVNLCKDKNWEKAEALNDKLACFFKALFIEPNPVPAKTAMAMAGMIANPYVRLPLCKMAESNLEILKAELKKVPVKQEEKKDLVTNQTGPARPVTVKGKVGRNEPCPCGSGKKYKDCCGK
jgi:dihydrodipicolinate synthase/N-acetylneuraminate lyase